MEPISWFHAESKNSLKMFKRTLRFWNQNKLRKIRNMLVTSNLFLNWPHPGQVTISWCHCWRQNFWLTQSGLLFLVNRPHFSQHFTVLTIVDIIHFQERLFISDSVPPAVSLFILAKSPNLHSYRLLSLRFC